MVLPAIAAAVGRVALGSAIRNALSTDDSTDESSSVSYQAPDYSAGLSRVAEFETGRSN